jgi:hypothetical protein
MGIGTVIFLIFLVLKLAEVGVVATWSWWWVFSPIWITLGLYLFLLGIQFLLRMGISLMEVVESRNSPEARLIPRRSFFWWV